MWKKLQTIQETRQEKKIREVISNLTPEDWKEYGKTIDLADTTEAKTTTDLTDATGTNYLNRTDTPNVGGWTYVQRHELRADPESFVYCSTIIANHAHFFDNAEHREIVHEMNAILAATCSKVPKAVWSQNPLFLKPDPKVKSYKDLETYTECEEWFNKHEGLLMMRKMTKKSMKHNYVVYEPLDTFALDWYTDPPWKLYAKDEIEGVLKWKFGQPTTFAIHPSNAKYSAGYNIDVTKKFGELNSEGYRLQDHVNSTKPLNQNKTGSYTSGGIYFNILKTDDLEARMWYLGAWNSIQDYEAMNESQNSFKQTISTGFMVVGIPTDDYDDLKVLAQEKIKRARRGRGIVIPTSVDQPMELDWMAIPDADFTVTKADIRKDIIAVIGLPERWLFGDAAGALAAADDDRYAVHDELRYIFYLMAPIIKQLLVYHKIIEKVEDVEIHPPFELQLTEMEKAEIDAIKSNSVLAMSEFITVDEMRNYMGFDELTEEQKSELRERQEMENGDEESDDSDDNRDLKDAIAKYEIMSEFIDNSTYDDLQEALGVTRHQIKKIKDNFSKPMDLMDSVDLMDSISLGNEIYQFEGIGIPAQEKYYPEHDITCIRSIEEIDKYYQDPSNRKDFPYGITTNDDHPDGIEVYGKDTIGKVELIGMSPLGAKVRYTVDLKKTREVLGPNNWIETNIKNNRKIPSSVALRVNTVTLGNKKKYECKLDVRSFVATRKPKNKIAGGI